MQLHNNGWRITRIGTVYQLRPPSVIDPDQRPVPLQSKSPIIRQLRDTHSMVDSMPSTEGSLVLHGDTRIR